MAKDILIANQHTGGIVFPRRSGGISLPCVRLAPGTVTKVDSDLWNTVKANPIVQAYLDKNILRIVKRENENVPVSESTTTNPEELIRSVAPHLADDEVEVEKGSAKAKVTKKKVGTVTV
jgi:hypothetical protein